MRSSIIYFVFLVCIFLLWNAPSFAQEGPPPMGRPGGARLEQFKKMRLLEELKLSEETSVRFIAKYNKHMDELKEIGKKRNQLIDKLENAIDSKSDDAQITGLINDITLSEEKILELRKKYFADLKEILTEKQIAKYVVFERKFNQNIRDIMREMAQDRWNRRRDRE